MIVAAQKLNDILLTASQYNKNININVGRATNLLSDI
jgi:hypothetical protein